jgi:type II secretory pathway component PulF
MLYLYKALENTGEKKEGTIEAVSIEVAIDSLQKHGLIITEINPAEKESWLENFIQTNGHTFQRTSLCVENFLFTFF